MSYTPPFLPPASPPQLPLVPPKKHHRGRNWAIAMSAFVLMGVTGLSFATSSSPSTASSAAATTILATTIPQVSPADAYLASLDKYDSVFANGSQSGILAVGLDMCTQFSDGDSVTYIEDYGVGVDNETGDGYTVSQLGDMMGAAVEHLCPAYQPEINAYDASQGY